MRKKNSEFDDLIRNKMEDLQPAYDPSSWHLLQRRMDRAAAAGQPVADDEQFDRLVSDKLNRIKPPYQRANWHKLVARLDKQDRIIRFVQRAKTMEVAVACFFLLLLGQLPSGTPGELPTPTPASRPARAQAALERPTQTIQQADYAAQLPTKTATGLTTATKHPEYAIPGSQAANQPSGAEISSDIAASGSAPNPAANAAQVDRLPSNSLVSPSPQTPNPSLRAEIYKPIPINAYEFAPAEPLAGIDAFGMSRYLYPEIAPDDLPPYKPLYKKRFVRVGMLGSSDINRIITPPITIGSQQEKVSYDRYSLGYGGGITLGFETYRWEVETGLVYAAKRYTPLQILYVEGSVKSGFFGASLQHFELNTINVPLHFRYNYFIRDKWRLYSFAGASWHVVTQANYYINFRPDVYALQAPAPLDSSPGRTSGLEEENLVKGWLEGGSFMQNSYISVNGGMGIERYMSTRWSLFAQPTYQHSLLYFGNGLGPYNDRMHSMSILMGLKVRL